MQFFEWILIAESKQVIVDMGFPEIISKILYEKYGKNAPLIAKWYKEYRAYGSYANKPDWWREVTWNPRENPSLYGLTYLYAASHDPDEFIEAADKMDFSLPHNVDITPELLDQERPKLVRQIKDEFFGYTFFTYYRLIEDITSGKLTDIAPYKRLSFHDATIKYDQRHHFSEVKPLKTYPNGFKWINTGERSSLLAQQMSNCGSAGIMSTDKDRTIVTLFGPNNKPHVMVVWSPNQNRISGDQCAGSTAVKPEYHNYVIDLAQTLGAKFDYQDTKSTPLRIKYLLQNKAQSIEIIPTEKYATELVRFTANGQSFYTDGYSVVPEADIQRIQDMVTRGEITLPYQHRGVIDATFAPANKPILAHYGVNYTPLIKFGEQ